MLKKLHLSSWVTYSFIIAAALVWFIPLFWMVYTAFRPSKLALSQQFSFEFTLQNFVTVWQGAPFAIYYLNTLLIVVGVLVVQMVTGTMAAYAFAKVNFLGRSLLFTLFLIQIMVPNDVLIFPNYMTLKEMSLLDTKLGIMIPFFATSFGIFLLRQHFKTIPNELEEAAKVEGYSKWSIIWRIYFPLSKSAYLSFGLVSVSYHWNNFLWPLIVTNSVENRPLTVGLAIFAQAAETGAQWAEVSAATLIVAAPLLIGFFVFQRQFIQSFMQSGIK
ncbi:carbohydrate ABC transporter permease [Paenibacillus sp. Root444D2]|uniref:carbohydrate ABC transporter permease n=1 Tax=Paenibacillus sp. Root444D2 TaxID=1736538 RepID=UPI00070C7518|nr:carbohydrate ABC transporter permease [Paenibacillus sp. Root444D2]KQX45731.1 ABC transporter permease [Paenibacillus sp. Root444D2]